VFVPNTKQTLEKTEVESKMDYPERHKTPAIFDKRHRTKCWRFIDRRTKNDVQAKYEIHLS